MRKEYEKWRKENPDQAKELDKECDAMMAKVKKLSEAKYGKQRPGIYRIDSSMF